MSFPLKSNSFNWVKLINASSSISWMVLFFKIKTVKLEMPGNLGIKRIWLLVICNWIDWFDWIGWSWSAPKFLGLSQTMSKCPGRREVWQGCPRAWLGPAIACQASQETTSLWKHCKLPLETQRFRLQLIQLAYLVHGVYCFCSIVQMSSFPFVFHSPLLTPR